MMLRTMMITTKDAKDTKERTVCYLVSSARNAESEDVHGQEHDGQVKTICSFVSFVSVVVDRRVLLLGRQFP
jgi:hypothetical protein